MKILYTNTVTKQKQLFNISIRIHSCWVQKDRYYIKGICRRYQNSSLGFTYVYDEAAAKEYIYFNDDNINLHSLSESERRNFSALILNMKYNNKKTKRQQSKIL